jgi:hypothetical protein
MTDAISSLVSVLEQSQQKDTPAPALAKHLSAVDVVIDENPALEPASLQRLVSVLCSWLRAHEEFQDDFCIRTIMKLLAKLLGQDQASDNIAIQKGLLSCTTDLLKRHLTDGVMLKYCLEVLATLSVVESSDTIIARLGAVPTLVELLRKHRDNYSVLEDAVTALAILAKRTRHRRALKDSGGITILVDLLKRCIGRPTLVVAVCRFLSNFAVKEDCCLTVLHHGGVDALMAAFDNSVDTSTRASVASAIWTCSADCGEVQKSLLASGWMTSLAAVLQANLDHSPLHEAALGIVRGLSRSAQYREDIVNLGFIDATIQAMKAFDDNTTLLKEACGVFGNLASDPDLRVQLGESGVIQQVLSVLSKCRTHDDRKVAKLALGTISNLASSEANRDVFAKTDAVQVLLQSARLFMQNENILEYAIGAISHIAVHESCNSQLIKGGAIEALLLFIGEHREDLAVVSKALVALRRLLSRSAGQHATVLRQIACAGSSTGNRGIYLLVEAMQAHIYDETATRETALLLSSLSSIPANVPILMQAALQPCTKALEVHQNDFSVADALAGLLASLPIEEDDTWAQDITASTLDKSDTLSGSIGDAKSKVMGRASGATGGTGGTGGKRLGSSSINTPLAY